MAQSRRTRHGRALLAAALIPALGSCAVLLDFDELQGGEAPVTDSGSPGGASGAGSGGLGATSGAGGVGALSGAGGATGGVSSDGGGILDGGIVDASTDGSGFPDVDAGPQVPLSELPVVLADAICSTLGVCAGPLLEIFTGAEDCRTLFTRTLEDGYTSAIQSSIDAGQTTYDPSLAAECVQNLVSAAAQQPPACSAFNATIEECKAALGGLSDAGGPCAHDFDCARALHCSFDSGCPGQCVPLGSASDPCTKNEDCDPTQNLYCQMGASDGGTDAGAVGACTAYLPVNADCTLGGQACEVGTFCLENKCLRIADAFTSAEGFDCVSTGTLCREGLSCALNGGWSCIAELTPLATCRFALPDACPAGFYCSASLFFAGQCLALPTENQPCANSFMVNVGLAPACDAGLLCVDGICKSKRRLDESCEVHGQCYSGLCLPTEASATGTCAPPVCQ